MSEPGDLHRVQPGRHVADGVVAAGVTQGAEARAHHDHLGGGQGVTGLGIDDAPPDRTHPGVVPGVVPGVARRCLESRPELGHGRRRGIPKAGHRGKQQPPDDPEQKSRSHPVPPSHHAGSIPPDVRPRGVPPAVQPFWWNRPKVRRRVLQSQCIRICIQILSDPRGDSSPVLLPPAPLASPPPVRKFPLTRGVDGRFHSAGPGRAPALPGGRHPVGCLAGPRPEGWDRLLPGRPRPAVVGRGLFSVVATETSTLTFLSIPGRELHGHPGFPPAHPGLSGWAASW
jgi:hypothetical protein